MKRLHLAMQINVPSHYVMAIEYGAEGEYDLNSHEIEMVHRLSNEKLAHCYNHILDWGREGYMKPDSLFQIHDYLDHPCCVLRVWCPIPQGMQKLYQRMNKIAKDTIHSYMYDWSIYDTHSIFSNPLHTPFLWSVGRCGTYIGMLNMENTMEYIEKFYDKGVFEAYQNDRTYMDSAFSTNVFSTDNHAYYYDGTRLREVSREQALSIQHEWNAKVVKEWECRMNNKAA